MKALWSLVFVLLLAVPPVLCIPSPEGQTTKEVLGIPNLMSEVVAPYVAVGTPGDDYIGAGTTILYRGEVYILTAGHVVNAINGPLAHVRKQSEEGSQTATVWVCDVVGFRYERTGWDLGLLKPRDPVGLTPARYTGCISLYRGQEAWVMGTPGGLENMLEKTIVSRPKWFSDLHEWQGDRQVYRTVVNGNLWYGNSGGGVFVSQGDHYSLVGVVVELARPGEKAQALVVTQEDLNTFLGEFEDYPWKGPKAEKGDFDPATQK